MTRYCQFEYAYSKKEYVKVTRIKCEICEQRECSNAVQCNFSSRRLFEVQGDYWGVQRRDVSTEGLFK